MFDWILVVLGGIRKIKTVRAVSEKSRRYGIVILYCIVLYCTVLHP